MSTNDITGDEIRSRVSSEKFRENWDAIFGKKEDKDAEEATKEENDGKL